MAVEPSRWGIIYNPKAGSRKTQKRWNEIRNYMESRKVVFDYVQSEGFGSVERLARTLANNGYRTIVVVGGDGAINDAVNGIMSSSAEDKENIALGIIPNGIGNDFAKYWGLDEDNYKQAVDWIINRLTVISSMPFTLGWAPVLCKSRMEPVVFGEFVNSHLPLPCSCCCLNVSFIVCICVSMTNIFVVVL